ncbi:MAG: YafY family transcriptional regulator [Anaerolineae bacterium]|nr:YafY family transcriptional regulator [Anaerolineae bacterium]
MQHPTTRVLTVLELLQAYPQITGRELAARLEVDVRTVRRYITILQDLGIPVEAERGRYGAYHLSPGFKLPPLMFNDDEALAVTLGLRLTKQLRLSADVGATDGALAKIQRVLPHALQDRAKAVEAALSVNLSLPAFSPPGTVVISLSYAVHYHHRVRLRYQSWKGEGTERAFDPYGIVLHDGYWYTIGYCHLREDVRTFRLDRITELTLEERRFEAPANFDAVAALMKSVVETPGVYVIEALLMTTLENANQLIPRWLGVLEETPRGVLLRCNFQRLAWIAHFLMGLECPVHVIQPIELRQEMQRLAEHVRLIALTNPP